MAAIISSSKAVSPASHTLHRFICIPGVLGQLCMSISISQSYTGVHWSVIFSLKLLPGGSCWGWEISLRPKDWQQVRLHHWLQHFCYFFCYFLDERLGFVQKIIHHWFFIFATFLFFWMINRATSKRLTSSIVHIQFCCSVTLTLGLLICAVCEEKHAQKM